MMARRSFISRLRDDQRGAMLVETALVTPALVLFSLGAYQVSGIVARQAELESAASEAAAIVLASKPDTASERTTIAAVIGTSTDLPSTSANGATSANGVAVTQAFRCNSNTVYLTSSSSCTSGHLSSYVMISLNDTYTPAWTEFGVGSPITYRVRRYVMYQQDELD